MPDIHAYLSFFLRAVFWGPWASIVNRNAPDSKLFYSPTKVTLPPPSYPKTSHPIPVWRAFQGWSSNHQITCDHQITRSHTPPLPVYPISSPPIPVWRRVERYPGFVAQVRAPRLRRFARSGIEALLPVHTKQLVDRRRPRLRYNIFAAQALAPGLRRFCAIWEGGTPACAAG